MREAPLFRSARISAKLLTTPFRLLSPKGAAELPLFKTPVEILAQGHDLVLRGDFVQARERFSEASTKFTKQRDMMGANLASVYAAVMAVGQGISNPQAYRTASQSLLTLGPYMFKVGLREVPAQQLALELDLLAAELEVTSMAPSDPQQFGEKAKALQELAMRFRAQLAGQVLVIPELFTKTVVVGEAKAAPLMAQAEEAIGESLILQDPKAAAEHYQSARLWWIQAGRLDQADAASTHMKEYGRAAKCWFCGREVSGEGIHFVAMPSELTDLVKQRGQGSALPTFDAATNSVYACKGCYGAVFQLADAIAVKRTGELEAKVQKQIDEIKSQISQIKGRIG